MLSNPAQHEATQDDWDDLTIDHAIIARMQAGEFVSGEAVKRWIRSWGTDDELPTPKIGD